MTSTRPNKSIVVLLFCQNVASQKNLNKRQKKDGAPCVDGDVCKLHCILNKKLATLKSFSSRKSRHPYTRRMRKSVSVTLIRVLFYTVEANHCDVCRKLKQAEQKSLALFPFTEREIDKERDTERSVRRGQCVGG